MKKYHDNKSYNAIVEAMQQIRYNALVEEYGEDEMEEAYGAVGLDGAMNTMAQGRLPAMYEEDEEEMAEMSDEEEQMVAEMMDEALYEMDMDDDEDNLNEADDGRKARRRKRLRQALLIGAGLAAAGLGGAGLGAAYTKGRGMRDTGGPAGGPMPNLKGGFGGILQDIKTGGSALTQDAAIAAGNAAKAARQAGVRAYYTDPTLAKLRGYKGTASGR